MIGRTLHKMLPRLTSILLVVSFISFLSVSVVAIDIPEKICSSGAVENNSVSLYIKGSIGQPIIQNCNSAALYMKSGFIRSYSAINEQQCYPGDANNDKTLNILDVVYLINYKYKDGPSPVPEGICSGDSNCDCFVNILDVVLLINFKYKSGLPPCNYKNWRSTCD